MGTTTRGWVEYRRREWADDPLEADGWRALLNLQEMLNRGQAFFGSMFGVDNEAQFEPVAPDRDLPRPLSRIARLDFGEEAGAHPSWITMAELQRVDWDAEPALPEIDTEHGWNQAVERTEKYDERGRQVATEVDAWQELPAEKLGTLAADREVTHGEFTYYVVPRRRGDLGVHDWPTLWSWLTDLANRWELDPRNVRLVVWFV